MIGSLTTESPIRESSFMGGKRSLPMNADTQLQAYVIGLAIGDGNLSNPSGRAVRLRSGRVPCGPCDARTSHTTFPKS
jgi:hypothetical protein